MKSILKFIGLVALTGTVLTVSGQSNFINFDDGSANQPVGSFYSARGVTFSNALWVVNDAGTVYCLGQGTPPLCITGASVPGFVSATNPVVALFTVPQQQVSILGVNVGFGGVRLEAYDALIGGSLVDSTQQFGTTLKGEYPTNSCDGVVSNEDNFEITEEYLLQVNAPKISRIELYRPNPDADDGVFWDNLSFTSCSGVCPPLFITLSTPDEVSLTWTSCPSANYQVEYSSDLSTNGWTSLSATNIPGTGSIINLSDPRSGAQRFYRLKSLPQT
jgi:hypothetical protein